MSRYVRSLIWGLALTETSMEGHNATNLNNYSGAMNPADGCKVIVKEALAKEGRTSVFIQKDGDYPW